MIGAIVGAVAQVGGAVANGIITANKQKKIDEARKKYFNEAKDDEQRWYEREYNTVYTDRADAQAAATRMAEAIRERQKQRAGAQAVMGGTEEAMQAAQAGDAKAIADAQAEFAIANEARKDQISQQYRQRMADIKAQEYGQNTQAEQAKIQNVTNAVNGVTKAAGSLAESLDGMQTSKAQPYDITANCYNVNMSNQAQREGAAVELAKMKSV